MGGALVKIVLGKIPFRTHSLVTKTFSQFVLSQSRGVQSQSPRAADREDESIKNQRLRSDSKSERLSSRSDDVIEIYSDEELPEAGVPQVQHGELEEPFTSGSENTMLDRELKMTFQEFVLRLKDLSSFKKKETLLAILEPAPALLEEPADDDDESIGEEDKTMFEKDNELWRKYCHPKTLQSLNNISDEMMLPLAPENQEKEQTL